MADAEDAEEAVIPSGQHRGKTVDAQVLCETDVLM
jgi:hypothetical protein